MGEPAVYSEPENQTSEMSLIDNTDLLDIAEWCGRIPGFAAQ
jgi:hypothetical protein